MITCRLLLHVTIPVHNYITTLSYNRLTTQTPNDHYKYNIMCEKFIYRSCVELRLQRGRGGGGVWMTRVLSWLYKVILLCDFVNFKT